MISPIKIGSRQSPLAKIQVQEVISLVGAGSPSPLAQTGGVTPPLQYELITFKTQGDIDQKTSLTTNPADNFFTDTLDEALLHKDIDIAIHSAKDLPKELPEGLKIFALTKAIDETDCWVSSYAIDQLPPGAKVGTSSLLRGEMIKSIRPDIVLTDIRGTIEQRLDLLEQKQIDGLIVATCALKRLGLEKHIHSILPWEATALQGQLAVVGRAGDWELEKLFHSIDVRSTYGQVFLVGAGPGDPQLITLKAIELLRIAHCVFYDYLAHPSLLKYAPQAEHIYAGKRKGSHSIPQQELSRQLKNKALQGKIVVRLKGGDPLVFGRGAEEILYLRSYHIPVHIVPGVSSATGIPSLLGVPLTARGVSSSVAFVSAHGEDEVSDVKDHITIPHANTIVFLMGLTKLKQIVRALLLAGWSKTKPIMIVSNGTKTNEKIIVGTLATIESLAFCNAMTAPALIVAGDTVNFYRPQREKALLHCGTNPEKYAHYGKILSWPMIQLEPISLAPLMAKELIQDFDQSDFVVLTSPAAVEHFMKIILGLKPANIVLKKIFAVIGRSTADALDEFGIAAKIISSQETAEGLFELLSKIIELQNKKILLPRSSLPNEFLKQALLAKGAQVKEWTVYTNIKPPKRPLPQISIDGVIFTSPSTFSNFLEDYGTIPASWRILAKGPVTAKALEKAGYQPDMVGI